MFHMFGRWDVQNISSVFLIKRKKWKWHSWVYLKIFKTVAEHKEQISRLSVTFYFRWREVFCLFVHCGFFSPHTNQLSSSSISIGCHTIQFNSDINYTDLPWDPTGLRVQSQNNCPYFRHQLQISGPQVTNTSVLLGYKAGGTTHRFNNLLEWFIELRKMLYLAVIAYYSWYKWTARLRRI